MLEPWLAGGGIKGTKFLSHFGPKMYFALFYNE